MDSAISACSSDSSTLLFTTAPSSASVSGTGGPASPQHQQQLALALRSTNWQLAPKLEQHIYWTTERLFVELQWSPQRFSPHPEQISIQNNVMPSTEKAVEYLRHILDNAICIRRVDLNINVSTTQSVDALLKVLSEHERVRLEELFVRRRYLGIKFPGLANLIRANAKTLREIGKIGLGEAIEAFTEEVHLQRLSLFNFDLVGPDEGLNSAELVSNSNYYIRRLAGLHATFDHLSFTCYTGFEITRMPALHMLRQCKVKSLRLTMQNGLAIADPQLPRPLLPMLKRIQLVGCMEVCSQRLSLLFPALEQLDIDHQDLITGRRLEKRARVLSDYAPDFVGGAVVSVAAGGEADANGGIGIAGIGPIAAAS